MYYSIKFVEIGIVFMLRLIPTFCKYEEGHLRSRTDWEFLTRFCFLSNIGMLEYFFEYPKEYAVQNIGLYYDSPHQWPAVYNTDTNCSSKRDALSVDDFQIIFLHPADYDSGCLEFNRTDIYGNYITFYRCKGVRSFVSSRERWWFIAAMNCQTQTQPRLDLKYKLTLTNGHKGEFFFRQFSADEFYILQTDIGALLFYAVITIFSLVVAAQLKSRQFLHMTYKLYLVSVIFQFFSLLFLCIAYGKYAENGIGSQISKNFGRFLAAISILIFELLLILIGKGYTVTRARLRQITVFKIVIFFSFYAVTYISLFIYNAQFMDPGEVLYIYESPAGYGIIIMRFIGWLWFTYAIIFTIKHYPEKSPFYLIFFSFYTLWFVATPLMIIIATFRIDKWAREKVVNGIELTIAFFGHFFFLVLMMPFMFNKLFPFHVRTAQVGVVSDGNNGSIKDDIGSYPHNVYGANEHNYISEPIPMSQPVHQMFVTSQQTLPPSSSPFNFQYSNNPIISNQRNTLQQGAVTLHDLSRQSVSYRQ